MMDCFVPYEPIMPSKFELAVKEEIPDLYEDLIKYIRNAKLNEFPIRLFFLMKAFELLEDIYDKEGRVGLRNFEKTRIMTKDAYENADGN